MKKSLLITSLFLVLTSCGIFSSTAFSASGDNDTIKPIPQINKEFLVVVHIILSRDSLPHIDTNAIKSTVAATNAIFAPIGASFTICEFRYIYNYNYDQESQSNMNETKILYQVPKRINIFYSETIDGGDCGKASLGGVQGSGNMYEGLFISKSCNNKVTLGHELGHYFSLLHTFEESGVELADGSNCSTAGDKICDTPADPFIHGDDVFKYVNHACEFISDKKDVNGQYYDPDVSNIMSYYPCSCDRYFTRDQYIQMANFYLQNAYKW